MLCDVDVDVVCSVSVLMRYNQSTLSFPILFLPYLTIQPTNHPSIQANENKIQKEKQTKRKRRLMKMKEENIYTTTRRPVVCGVILIVLSISNVVVWCLIIVVCVHPLVVVVVVVCCLLACYSFIVHRTLYSIYLPFYRICEVNISFFDFNHFVACVFG